MGPIEALMSGVMTVFFYALVVAAVWKIFQMVSELGEIKTILSDIRRNMASPAAKPAEAVLPTAPPPTAPPPTAQPEARPTALPATETPRPRPSPPPTDTPPPPRPTFDASAARVSPEAPARGTPGRPTPTRKPGAYYEPSDYRPAVTWTPTPDKRRS